MPFCTPYICTYEKLAHVSCCVRYQPLWPCRIPSKNIKTSVRTSHCLSTKFSAEERNERNEDMALNYDRPLTNVWEKLSPSWEWKVTCSLTGARWNYSYTLSTLLSRLYKYQGTSCAAPFFYLILRRVTRAKFPARNVFGLRVQAG